MYASARHFVFFSFVYLKEGGESTRMKRRKEEQEKKKREKEKEKKKEKKKRKKKNTQWANWERGSQPPLGLI